jgi:hypothetical protein
LALPIVVTPGRAKHFLTGCASSFRAHYTEQALRLVAGSALVIFAATRAIGSSFA